MSCACARVFRSMTSSACAWRAASSWPLLSSAHPPVDRVQRRAELVRDSRDELVLRAAERLGGVPAGLFLLEQLRPVPIDFALRLIAFPHARLENGGGIPQGGRQIVQFRDARWKRLRRFAARE